MIRIINDNNFFWLECDCSIDLKFQVLYILLRFLKTKVISSYLVFSNDCKAHVQLFFSGRWSHFWQKKHGVLKRDGLQTPPANKVFGSHLASLQGQGRFVAIEVLFGEMLMWQVFMTFLGWLRSLWITWVEKWFAGWWKPQNIEPFHVQPYLGRIPILTLFQRVETTN